MKLVNTSDLASSIACRDAAIAKFTAAAALIDEATALVAKASASFTSITASPMLLNARSHTKGFPFTLDLQAIRQDIDKALWTNTLDASGLTAIISQKAYNDAIDSLRTDVPTFSKENVASSYRDFAERAGELENSGLVDVFKDLSWCYKSNSPVRLGKRIVINAMLTDGYFNYERAYKLNDLERVVCRARQQSIPQGDQSLYNRVRTKGQHRVDGLYEDSEFKLRWFGNGNMHVYIKRQSVIDALNQRIAEAYGPTLPPTRRGK